MNENEYSGEELMEKIIKVLEFENRTNRYISEMLKKLYELKQCRLVKELCPIFNQLK